MQRILVVYNPRSSRFKDVRADILDVLNNPTRMQEMSLNGMLVGKYEVEKTNVDDNAAKLAKLIRDGDVVLAVGGDATAVIVANGILLSKKDAALAALPYGNFNDLAKMLKVKTLTDVFKAKTAKLWPLEVLVDGKHLRYSTCYTTIGMMAEATELFDNKKVRKSLRKGYKSSWRSYPKLAKWYFKNRSKRVFLPEFKLNGLLQKKNTTDYLAVNGKKLARVMRGGEWHKDARTFWHTTGRLKSFFRLSMFMAKSMLKRVPGEETKGDKLEFLVPATVEFQSEGEYRILENIEKIEIKKAEQFLKVLYL